VDTKSLRLLLLSIAVLLFCIVLVLVSFVWLLLDAAPRIISLDNTLAPLAGARALLACLLGHAALALAVQGFNSAG
jgi:hypothetical protein